MSEPKTKFFECIADIKSPCKGQTFTNYREIRSYLHRFGYFHGDCENDLHDDECAQALKVYQRCFGLRATGRLNNETRLAMMTPRCGCPDRPKIMRSLGAAAVNASPGRLKPVNGSVNYEIHGDHPGNFHGSGDAFDQVVDAFDAWNKALGTDRPFEFTPGSDPQIIVQWVSENDHHGDSESEVTLNENVRDVIAHADFPRPDSFFATQDDQPYPLHFNNQLMWLNHNRNDLNEPPGYDVQSIAIHEIGHLLGLRHNFTPGQTSVMKANAQPNQSKWRKIAPADIAKVKALYRGELIAGLPTDFREAALMAGEATTPSDVVRETILRRIENIEHELAGLRKLVEKLGA